MNVNEIIEKVLAEATLNQMIGAKQRKELTAAIVKELRKEYLIIPYGGQVTFE